MDTSHEQLSVIQTSKLSQNRFSQADRVSSFEAGAAGTEVIPFHLTTSLTPRHIIQPGRGLDALTSQAFFL